MCQVFPIFFHVMFFSFDLLSKADIDTEDECLIFLNPFQKVCGQPGRHVHPGRWWIRLHNGGRGGGDGPSRKVKHPAGTGKFILFVGIQHLPTKKFPKVLDQFHQKEEANRRMREELDLLQSKLGAAKHQVLDTPNKITINGFDF